MFRKLVVHCHRVIANPAASVFSSSKRPLVRVATGEGTSPKFPSASQLFHPKANTRSPSVALPLPRGGAKKTTLNQPQNDEPRAVSVNFLPGRPCLTLVWIQMGFPGKFLLWLRAMCIIGSTPCGACLLRVQPLAGLPPEAHLETVPPTPLLDTVEEMELYVAPKGWPNYRGLVVGPVVGPQLFCGFVWVDGSLAGENEGLWIGVNLQQFLDTKSHCDAPHPGTCTQCRAAAMLSSLSWVITG